MRHLSGLVPRRNALGITTLDCNFLIKRFDCVGDFLHVLIVLVLDSIFLILFVFNRVFPHHSLPKSVPDPIRSTTMNDRDAVKSILDTLFLIKAQLRDDETALLRSILSIAIMESEDLLDDYSKNIDISVERPRRVGKR